MDITSAIMMLIFIAAMVLCVWALQAWFGLPFWAAGLIGGPGAWAGVMLVVWLTSGRGHD